jgi:hypothetical protein
MGRACGPEDKYKSRFPSGMTKVEVDGSGGTLEGAAFGSRFRIGLVRGLFDGDGFG